MADKVAARGLTVYIPDLHSGNSLEHEIYKCMTDTPDADICDSVRFFASVPSLISWRGQHGEKQTLLILDRAIAAINTLGAIKLGVQGFCWGGKFSVLMGASDKFMAIAANHPSGIIYFQ
jgi:dienelactone hydrolase